MVYMHSSLDRCLLLLISEIARSVFDYPVPHKQISWLFLLSLLTYHLNIMVSTTQTLSQIKSQEFIGHIKQLGASRPLT